MRTSITYRLPGNFRLTYLGDPKPLRQWIALTWDAGAVLWRIWITEALFFIATGRLPYPKQVSAKVIGDIKVAVEKYRSQRPEIDPQTEYARKLLGSKDETLDEGQQRMVKATEDLLNIPSVYAHLHEHDEKLRDA